MTQFKIIEKYRADFSEQLSQALVQIELALTAQQQQTLLMYLDKLLLWNKAYNLTAITEPKEALIKHLFDCLSIVPFLNDGTLLDIGTGAGLPGVIIAICQPERHCTVLDSNQKKIRFIKQISSELALKNITPIASRIEHYEGQFDVVTSRAFASLTDFVTLASPKMQANGCLQAMKGHAPEVEERQQLSATWNIDVVPLSVPQLPDTRHLVNLHLI
ncbi:16S rRNA (guanine(527)-N(7))-methyltransferase RsmG [Psychrobacter sp. I-STPA6b]|uniref:16S rRNA (guanine(527)-N(7))-methyltransferase RsmG n=1 Tax=Psychrobacter sp. I-STPA6b TaxID=2585718 RepID=UPI001D0BF83A|nr:16S rRNA (guanine(527)-N(7))-methyltransferase RsmG [Psychrobacter sp. I-STPA6b]